MLLDPVANFRSFSQLLMIITGLIGGLVVSQYKWAYFAGGCVAMFFVFYQLIGPGRSSAKAISSQAYNAYFRSALVLSVLWFLYPIAWVSAVLARLLPMPLLISFIA